MATNPPKSALIVLPPWLWNGHVAGFLTSAGLESVPVGPNEDNYRVRAIERGRHDRSGSRLVDSVDLDRLTADDRQAVFAATEGAVPAGVAPPDPSDPRLAEVLTKLADQAVAASAAGYLTPSLALHQLRTMTSHPGWACGVVEQTVAHLRSDTFRVAESGALLFPGADAHLVRRAPALIHRSRLPALLIRVEHDERLQRGDLSQALADLESGKLVFASSGSLSDGMFLADIYFAPLLGNLLPFLWGFPAVRASCLIIYTLGRPIAATLDHPTEPLQLIRGRTTGTAITAPAVTAQALSRAIGWWARRLDRLLSVVTDPAVHTDSAGRYLPIKNLQAIASIEQLFRRTAAIQRGLREDDSRRVLLFTNLDILERVSSRRWFDMCRLSEARRVLASLQRQIDPEIAQVMLPAAERAVRALAAVQDGFFMDQHSPISYTALDGTTVTLDREDAAAHYIKLLRNATHGHGSNQPDAIARTNALLGHHTGETPYDLPDLSYLYLLDLLTNPDKLRRALWGSARS